MQYGEVQRLRAMIVDHEGLRLKPYRCTAGKLTIGVGRNLEDNGISPEEAQHLLDNDLARVERELTAAFPWFATLVPARRAVFMDMGFNLGLARLKGFRRMLQAVGRGDWERAAAEMGDSLWARQVGRRAERLAGMMRSGAWEAGG